MKRILFALLMIGVLLSFCACGDAPKPMLTEPDAVTQNSPVDVLPTEPAGNQEEVDEPDNNQCTLTVEAPADWTTAYVYTWDPEIFGTFPGSVMTQGADNTYTYRLDANVTNIIISNQDHAQTADLKVTAGVDVKIVVDSDCKAMITYPNGDGGVVVEALVDVSVGELSNYRVVGSADWLGNWDPAFEDGRMTKVSDGVYRKEFDNVPLGNYEIKITKDGKWGGDIGDNGQNYCFSVLQDGGITVDLYVKGDEGTISVYGPGTWME